MTHGTTRVVLIRHGESQVTVDRVIGGHRTCSGLSDLGRQQAARLHDRLAATHELDGAVLISSNFDRAIETAQIIGPAIAGAHIFSSVNFCLSAMEIVFFCPPAFPIFFFE